MTLISLSLTALLLAAPADDLAAARAKIDAEHAAETAKVAATCVNLGRPEEAERTRSWIVRREPGRQYLFLPPDADALPLPVGAPLVVQQWHAALTRERQRFADALMQHAKEALEAGDLARAMQLVHEALRENPDHAEARRILGFTRQGNRWQPDREPAAKKPTVPHGKFNWPASTYLRIESEHYRIATTAKRDAAIELAQRLEDLYCIWRQLYVSYWTDPVALKAVFEGKALGPRAGKSPLNVVLFADKKQYIAALQQLGAQIAISEGIYVDADHTAYFYAGNEVMSGPTCFHEATHQLFHESRIVAPAVAAQSNFWIVEGAALVMESLARHEGYYTLGGLDASRLQYARNWALSGGFHMPIAELEALGQRPLQQHVDIRKLYTESAGLTHLLMERRGGQDRQILATYLTQVYTGKAGPGTLPQLLGAAGPVLDAEYLRYLQVTDADLKATRLLPSTRNLCLGHTGVTDEGLMQLGELKQLDWLDLSFTAAGDATVARLAGTTSLTQLNLEAAKITDASLETIGKLTNLVDLDLSHTPITDAGLKHLAGLKKLKTLWLTDTKITDKGLPSLTPLKELTTLDLDRTAVTPAASERLKKQLPKVKE